MIWERKRRTTWSEAAQEGKAMNDQWNELWTRFDDLWEIFDGCGNVNANDYGCNGKLNLSSRKISKVPRW